MATSKLGPKQAPTGITTNMGELIRGKDYLGHSPGVERKVAITKMTPTITNKSLAISAQAYGTRMYQVTAVFYGVEYSDKRSPNFPLSVSTGPGQNAGMKQLDSSAKVQVRCTCPDFYFTWSYWDKKNKALSGPAMKPYVRKTTTYPERNPEHVPGACKHLITLFKNLRRQRIIK